MDSNPIEQFLRNYAREFDFFQEAARLVAENIESEIVRRGIRGIVTHRAKSPDRLKRKLEERTTRAKDPKSYQTVEDIYADIVDLAGARIALYFPGDQDKVGKMLFDLFEIEDPVRRFPDCDPKPRAKGLIGYLARHYRAKLKAERLDKIESRYVGVRVEVQVASVLMHAWSEVEHDLLYKTLQGDASEDEKAILDELNGLVLAGEIALERLQGSIEARVGKPDAKFTNEFELESFLSSKFPSREVGRVDFLMDLIRRANFDAPQALLQYMARLRPDTANGVADELIDMITADDPNRYQDFLSIWRNYKRQASRYAFDPTPDEEHALGNYLAKWVEVEQRLRDRAKAKQQPTTGKRIAELLDIIQVDSQTRGMILNLWRERNRVVHGVGLPPRQSLVAQTEDLDRLLATELALPPGHQP